MNRIRALNGYQKAVLLFTLLMAIAFSLAYGIIVPRVGFAYKDSLLLPRQEDGGTVYSGKLRGEQAVFTVYPDGTVAYRYGDKSYGLYTAREDPTAVPEDMEVTDLLTGVELRRGEDVIFRGGFLDVGGTLWLYDENGGADLPAISITADSGIITYANGREIDPVEPTASDILSLMNGPRLTHRGDGHAWVAGMLLCALTAVSVLFAEELFRWNLSFRIRGADRAEPSDWEIAGRYVSWTVLPLLAMALFVVGLR